MGLFVSVESYIEPLPVRFTLRHDTCLFILRLLKEARLNPGLNPNLGMAFELIQRKQTIPKFDTVKSVLLNTSVCETYSTLGLALFLRLKGLKFEAIDARIDLVNLLQYWGLYDTRPNQLSLIMNHWREKLECYCSPQLVSPTINSVSDFLIRSVELLFYTVVILEVQSKSSYVDIVNEWRECLMYANDDGDFKQLFVKVYHYAFGKYAESSIF